MAEYIDREALFAEFDRLGLGEHSIVEKVFSIGVRTIIAGMPAADVAPVVWIPVTDRLPEAGTRSNGWGGVTVIATNGKFVRPLIYERAIVRGKVVWRWKWPWDRIYDGNPVTHWMPLPEPPKGVSDNG